MKKYDLLVIGFGKAGKTLAAKYSALGNKVAVIEESKEMYGGTCINIGCIPTKTMIVAASENKNYYEAKNKKDIVVNKLREKNFNMLNNNANVDLYTASAKFVSNKVVEIVLGGDKEQLTAEIIVINTGAKNNVINVPGLATSKNVFDSTELQKLEFRPETLGILGGGNIGLEFAGLYAKLGVKVTIIDRAEHILMREDEKIAELAKEYLEEQGVVIKSSLTTEKISNNGDKVVVTTKEQGSLEFDALLHATGRKPNTENLGLENTEIKLAANGAVIVDKYCRTNVENVFAVGDVNGGLQFTYTSLDDFRIVFDYLVGDGSYTREDRVNVPYTIFLNPPLSRVGLSEKEARELGKEIIVKELPVANMPRGAVNGDQRGLFKAVVDKNTKQILGATLFGKNSEELINLIKMAMDNNIPYTYLKNQVFTHPTMAENFNDLFDM